MNYTFIFLIIFGGILAIYSLWENYNPKLTIYNLKINLPKNIKNLSILHISDLHNTGFGLKQEKLKRLIKKDYDLIFITGDLIDRRYLGLENAKDLIIFLAEKYKDKIYFVSGNHEKGSLEYSKLEKLLKKLNIKILNNDKIFYNENIDIVGIEDPAKYTSINKKTSNNESKIIETQLKKLINPEKTNLLLSHRPEVFELYCKYNVDLVFSGHSHGGQVKIFNRGLLAPDQGFFAKYCGGVFKKDNTIMVNSRGLGNNFPWAKRVFNRPHLVEVNLTSLVEL